MLLVAISILALLPGPALHRFAHRSGPMLSTLDGFILVSIAGLVAFFILPESFQKGGPWIFGFASIGLLGPDFLERRLRSLEKQTHRVAVLLAISGLALHSFLDGVALIQFSRGVSPDNSHLAWGVILHRIPVGLTIWWLLTPTAGPKRAWRFLALIALMTGLGYQLGLQTVEALSGEFVAWFQALMAGSLLHVVFHRPKSLPAEVALEGRDRHRYEAIGGAVASLTVAGLLIEGFSIPSSNHLQQSLDIFLSLALQSAPALLAGYLIAGLLTGFLPQASFSWMGKGGRLTQSFRGVAFGLPLPVCSCGVVPVYRALIRRGVPATAAMSFLVATPELGLDAVLLSIPLLGGTMTAVRVLAAFFVALLIGLLAGVLIGRQFDSSKVFSEDLALNDGPVDRTQRLKSSFRFGFVEMVDHTAPWILAGLAVAAVLHPLLKPGIFQQIPSGFEVSIFALLGMPSYVCASGATPFVAVLLFNGVSPGAALAFLLTGPATNISTFGLLAKLHGQKAAYLFALSIAMLSIGAGIAVNSILADFQAVPVDEFAAESASVLQMAMLVILLPILASSWFRQGPRGFLSQIFQPFSTLEKNH